MRKFILITAMVLVSATAHAGGQRSLTLASSDEPAQLRSKPNRPKPNPRCKPAEATPDAPKFVERPAVGDTKTEQPAAQCQPAATTADTARERPSATSPKTDKPKRRHQSTESRIISELHRHGIYW